MEQSIKNLDDLDFEKEQLIEFETLKKRLLFSERRYYYDDIIYQLRQNIQRIEHDIT